MKKNGINNHKGLSAVRMAGLTIIEMVVAASIAVIVVVGLAGALCDSQRGWNSMYNRAYSDVVTGTQIAGRTFDRIVRKSGTLYYQIDPDGEWLEVCYYADPNSVLIDRYARFFREESNFCIEYGRRSPRETVGIETVCGNVSSCVFKQTGRSFQMLLTLDDGKEKLTTVTSAVAHN